MTNATILGDINKILFCSGMFSYKSANKYAKEVFDVLIKSFKEYKEKNEYNGESTNLSTADEIKKYKDLLDEGIISQEEFDAKKKQLLNL